MSLDPIDISLLQIMKKRETFNRFKSLVNHKAIDPKTSYMLKLFGKYFDMSPDEDSIPIVKGFASWFFLQQELKPETRALYEMLLPQIDLTPTEATEALLIPRLIELDTAYKGAQLLTAYQAGEEVDIVRELKALTEEAERAMKVKLSIPMVPLDDSLFKDGLENRGFLWRWDALNSNMRKLRGGDFIIFAARPDQGKTSALADNVTFFAKQFEEVYPEDYDTRVWLWLNNEGPGKWVQQRIVQNALGMGTAALNELAQAGSLWSRYEEAIGGRFRIRVINIHGWFTWQVEELLRRMNPAGVIFDMIDNVKFSGSMTNGGTRTDQILEEMYKWGRDLAVINDIPIIATSQTLADAEGVPFPQLSMLKDSKTGKQGACEAIITMGNSPDDSLASVRFIGQTKNKLQLEGAPKSCQRKLILHSATGRFTE